MPRQRKKNGVKLERNSQLNVQCSDFTVYDYGRASKPINTWQTEVKQITGQPAAQQCEVSPLPDDWFEDICDKETLPPSNDSTAVIGRVMSCREVANDAGCVYPVDIWFLIGQFVSPEDIGTFARICHSTHVVVHSARFWLGVYRRFCRSASSLPETLQPDHVEQLVHGLRTRVVRALFHVYCPLSTRVGHRGNPAAAAAAIAAGAAAPPPADPERLVGYRCVLTWHERSSKQQMQWRFYFKFERGSARSASKQTRCRLSPRRACDSEHLLAPDDVLYNADERYVILLAVSPHFVDLPVVMGQVLVKASVTADGMFARRLRLVFSGEYVHVNQKTGTLSGAMTAEIDPLHSVNIFHWWDPGFPYRR